MKARYLCSLLIMLLPVIAQGGVDWSGIDLYDPELFVQGHIAVRFSQDIDLDAMHSSLAKTGVREVRRLEQLNAVEFSLPETMNVGEAIERFEVRPDVLYAEPVAIRRVFWTPNDPRFSEQWSFDPAHLDMPAAWDIEQGSSEVIIAILDSGIAYEDYAIPSYELGEVISADGYYHICPDFEASQFVAGYDCVHDDGHPNDQNGHGTHVAGTAAQATDNWIGVAGIAPGCKLMPVQVMNNLGSGDETTIAAGIMWATDHGAHVINMSLGSFLPWSPPSEIEHDAVKYAYDKGVVIVAAAGNFLGWDEVSYPARFEECIAVAATDYCNDLTAYSQHGEGLDISAPGGDEDADLNNDGNPDGIVQPTFRLMGDLFTEQQATVDEFEYRFLQGTSMATPHVSGLAALLISHGITGVENVKAAICATADDLGEAGYDTEYGWGLSNPFGALNYNPYLVEDSDQARGIVLDKSPGVFTHSTSIRYTLPEDTHLTLTVWDAAGRCVRTLVDEYQSQGDYSVCWNGTDEQGNRLSAGIYFVRISTSSYQTSRRMILLD
ncbi:S8 family serine peptidase [candidate division WOR-3 bacterium]|nr:S8 family serine peptidase [candidate division WOR-3 bacterium]